MKRILLALLILAFCYMPAEARDAFHGTVIEQEDGWLSGVTTTLTSEGIDVSQYDKVAFWVTYFEIETGGGVSADITLEISYDDSTYLSAKFYDYEGGATLQITENIAASGNYYFYWNRDLNIRYARVVATGNGIDDDDIALIIVNYSAQK